MEEGANQAKANTMKGNPENKIPTTDKTQGTIEAKRYEEGEVAIPDRANKTTPTSADTMARLATMRQSVARRRASRPLQADNSQTTPPTPTTTIVAGCL